MTLTASPSGIIGESSMSAKRKFTQTSPYPGWHDFVAGGVAGAGARILTQPLDLIRIRRQLTYSSRDAKRTKTSMWQDLVHVVKNEGGIRGLFRGNTAALGLWISYSAVQFSVYGTSKEYLQMVFPEESQRTIVAFGAGATAGVLATICTYPLDLCRTIFAAKGASVSTKVDCIASNGQRQHVPTRSETGNTTPTSSNIMPPKQQQNPKHPSFRPPTSTIEFATNLYKIQGWKGFFAGSAPTILQIVPYMGGSFAIYDALTVGDRGVGLSAYAGSIAGAVSKGLVYPIDTVKKRMQAQAFYGNTFSASRRPYTGIVDCMTTIYREEGIHAFYNGFVPSVLKTALAAGFTFAFFRSAKNLLESVHEKPFTKEDPPTTASLQRRITGKY